MGNENLTACDGLLFSPFLMAWLAKGADVVVIVGTTKGNPYDMVDFFGVPCHARLKAIAAEWFSFESALTLFSSGAPSGALCSPALHPMAFKRLLQRLALSCVGNPPDV